jgi:hypothetical protein
MNKKTEDGHLDLLQLDALRAGEGTQVDGEHLKNCARCRALLEEIEAGTRLLHAEPPPVTAVPPEVDEAILGEYRRRFGARRRRMLPAYGAAAAAVLALAVSTPLLRDLVREKETVPVPTAEAPAPVSAHADEDVNGDGRLDILDAFHLARKLKQDGAGRVKEDFNEDGRVNRVDVEILAQRAVKI